ncbi:flagellar motor protein [Amylibacter marinus]|uniref:Flagellar motor protein n=1 Tax=Amylibacter marinus TaxID=1475483 RepID=A0ABQ5VXU2_9RHOB|nr:peptidoglycan -binding protein [Amylibacter marinus]GLQ36082.1 flagellar motor protein [Amylibacter marinus]
MAIRRRAGNRFEASIWPGFVDAMTALLLILFFVLSIFMIVQFTLRETISDQSNALDDLTIELSGLAEALGLEQQRVSSLQASLSSSQNALDAAQAQVASQLSTILALTDKSNTQAERLSEFETQIAALLVTKETLEQENQAVLSEKEAVELALASARDEIDLQAEQARLAAAKREAMESLIADLEASGAFSEQQLAATRQELSELEQARVLEQAAAQALQQRLSDSGAALSAMTLAMEAQRKQAEETMALLLAAEAAKQTTEAEMADLTAKLDANAQSAALDLAKRQALEALIADLQSRDKLQSDQLRDVEQALSDAQKEQLLESAAAEALRQRLLAADTELSAMTLALEAQRREAEETLTLLAAAELANEKIIAEQIDQTEAQKNATLLAIANDMLAQEQAVSADSLRKVALLNAQTEELQKQLDDLQGLLDASAVADQQSQVQLQNLGKNLNAALARVAAEQKKRAKLEEREKERLAAEANDLRKFRSEFFGRLREIMEGREGVRIVGDRFVFSSEVLFAPGSANLGAGGQAEIRNVASIIHQVADQIPREIDWILRVDGHTDSTPLSAGGAFNDNWELSQARALSVVRYLINEQGIPADRLAANGFGEFQPLSDAETPEAYAINRRIELKFTEK